MKYSAFISSRVPKDSKCWHIADIPRGWLTRCVKVCSDQVCHLAYSYWEGESQML